MYIFNIETITENVLTINGRKDLHQKGVGYGPGGMTKGNCTKIA